MMSGKHARGAITEVVETMPAEKWATKIKRGIVAIFLLGLVAAEIMWQYYNVPWWVLLAIIFFAGVMFSPDLWKAPWKIFLGMLKDLLAAIRSGKE